MENHIGGRPEWMNEGYIEEILNKKEGQNVRVKEMSVSAGSSIGDNYTGQIFRIRVRLESDGGEETRSLIAKYLKPTSVLEEFSSNFDVFACETRMLDETLPRVLGEDRVHPECLYVDREHKTIYLEDLCERGYRMVRGTLLDHAHCAVVVRALAKLHAKSYLHILANPGVKEEYGENPWKEGNPGVAKWVKNGLGGIYENFDAWPISETRKNKLRNLEKVLLPAAYASKNYKHTSMNVLQHGDCWRNNMMFRYDGGKVAAVALVDFQLSSYNANAVELVGFIFSSSDAEVRARHVPALLRTYYEDFIAITGDIPGYDLNVLEADFNARLGIGLMFTLVFTPAMCLAEGEHFQLDEILKGEDMKEQNRVTLTNPNYVRAVVNSLDYFEAHGVL